MYTSTSTTPKIKKHLHFKVELGKSISNKSCRAMEIIFAPSYFMSVYMTTLPHPHPNQTHTYTHTKLLSVLYEVW